MNPFFSIIIPVFNKEDYIKDTLTSVINQSFDNYEVIIVDDGSTDNSLQICKQIKPQDFFIISCLLYTSPSPRDGATSRMPSSA